MSGKPPRAKPTGRSNQIARHPDRLSIELARVAGVSLDVIAARFEVKRDAIARHMAKLDPAYKAALAADVPIAELAERAAKEGGSLLDNLGVLRQGLMQATIIARVANDHHGHAALARLAMDVNKEIAKLTGEILRTPNITNITTNIAVIMSSPFMTALETMLARKLGPHPAALRDVMDGLMELQSQSSPPQIEALAHAA